MNTNDTSHIFNSFTPFPPNLLLHSRAFLRLALVVESHLCLHASVNCNTLQKKRRRERGMSFLDTDLPPILKVIESQYHLTYHRFSECSLKLPLLAEGFLDPKTCAITSGTQIVK